MTRVEKKLKLSDEKFKRRIGTTKPMFQTILAILQAAHDALHQPGGKPATLSVVDKLLITLKYYRELWLRTLLPWQLNFSKNRAVWREWANWHVAEFTEQSASLEISSNSTRRKNFPTRAVMPRSRCSR